MSYAEAQEMLLSVPEADRATVRIQATEIQNRFGVRWSDAVADSLSLYRAHGRAGLLTTDARR